MNRLVLCLVGFLLSGSMMLAQLPTGTILGVVKDSSGAVVPGANVTARETGTNQSRSTATGANGAYRFDALAVGSYEITVKANGFETLVQSGLTLAVGQESVSNLTLQVGGISQTVSVTAEASNLVSTTTSSMSSLVTPETIADLPLNGRDYTDLTLLQTGVTKSLNSNSGSTIGYSGTQFSSNGAPQRSNTYLLDGGLLMSMAGNNGASAMGTTLGIDGIQEYRIITNNFEAEYGMSMGSQTVVVTKGGTNTFHGDAFEFLRNSVLDARNYFDLPPSSVDLHGHRNPEFRRNQFGGSLGGPIQKDKTFFFVVYEGLRSYLGATETSSTLGTLANPNGCHGAANQTITLAQCPQLGAASATILPQIAPFLALWPLPNVAGTNNGAASNFGWIFNQAATEDYGQVRIDHTFSNSDNLFGRYTIDQAALPYPGSFNQSEAFSESRNQFFTLAENHIFSASLINTARYALTREPLYYSNTILDPRLLEPQFVLIAGQPLGLGTLSPSGVSGVGNSILSPRSEVETISTVADDVSYNRGTHAFKFGFIFNHYPEKVETHGYDRGTFAFASMAAFDQGITTSFSVSEPAQNDPIKYLDFDTMGFYGQDSWRLTPRFTLNLGMRYEPTTSVDEIHGHASNLHNPLTDTTPTVGNPVFKNPSLRNWSPRFGFAWDVFGDGKTAVRGGFDIVYDLSTLGTFYTFYAAYDPPFTENYSTTGYSATFGPLKNPIILPAVGSFIPAIRAPAWAMNQPHMLTYNLAIERQLPGQMSLSIAYAGSKGLNLYRGEEENNVLPSGIPAVDSAGKRICSLAPAGTVLNNANQFDDAAATSCYAYNTSTLLQCGLLINGPPVATTNCYNRLNDALPSVPIMHADATSLYNALDVNLTKRVTRGVTLNGSYTWSRLLDNNEAGGAQDGQSIPEEPLHPNSMWGPAIFDLTHSFHFTGIYQFPNFTTSKGFVSKLTNGWMMNGILTLQSGYPFSATGSADRENISWATGYGASEEIDIVPGRTSYNATHGVSTGCGSIPAGTPLGTPKLWYDPCAFSVQPAGFIGTESRDFLRGPGLHNVDFSLVKDTAVGFLGEGGKIEFRAEVFDLFNHPNFALPSLGAVSGSCPAVAGDPNGTIEGCSATPLSTAGTIASTITTAGALPGGQRQIQFGLKVMF